MSRIRQDSFRSRNNGMRSGLDVDRIMLERQMTSHNFDRDDSRYIGEVTGEEFDTSNIFDKGMPVRSAFTVKKSKFDNNSHLDFDLFSKNKSSDFDNVRYSDTSSGDYAGLDEAMKPITNGADPYETCVTDISSTTCWLHSNMFNISKDSYVVNGLGLFSAFGVIYLISRGNIELELKNYFQYQDKRHLNAGLLTLRSDMNKFRDQYVVDNFILNDKDVPSDGAMAKKLKSLIFNVVINKEYPEQEASRVNNIIETISSMSNVISPTTLSKSDVSLVSVAKLNPVWAYKIDDVIKRKTKDQYGQLIVNSLIRYVGKTFDYYEDAEKQIIEIPLYGIYSIGFIDKKRNSGSKATDLKSLTTVFNYMKPTVLDEVIFPMIIKRYKTRLNKTLQHTGLNMVFTSTDTNSLYPEGFVLDDCLQYIDINFSTKSANKKCQNRGYRTTRKFICNDNFEFYLKNTENNCILMMGIY